MKEAMRQRCIIWLGLFFFIAMPESVHSQNIAISEKLVYLERDTLKLDLVLDRLFSDRTLDAIESGMTTSVLLEFRVVSGRNRDTGVRGVETRLEHDIWDGQYRVIRYASSPDTLETTAFDSANVFCSRLKGLPLGVFPLKDELFNIRVRIGVNPISPEQQQRTRKWLNLLERGSFLELFVSLDQPAERTPWIEIWNSPPEKPE